MMTMFVLTLSQRNSLLSVKSQYQSLLNERHVDIDLIKIQTLDSNGDNYYVFPSDFVNNLQFSEVFDALRNNGELAAMTIRAVDPSEYFSYNVI